jgi:hypothetical protein
MRPPWASRWGIWPPVTCRICGGRTQFPTGWLRTTVAPDDTHPLCVTRQERGNPTPRCDMGDPEHLIVDGVDLGPRPPRYQWRDEKNT